MKGKRYIVFLFVAMLFSACTKEPDTGVVLHECAAMPSPRASSTCFVVDGQAYVFAGRDAEGHSLNDLWRYTPATDEWTNLGETPLSIRVNPTSCVVNDKVYIGLGFSGTYSQDSSYLQDWWEYTPATQEWRQLADYPNSYTDRATSFVGFRMFASLREVVITKKSTTSISSNLLMMQSLSTEGRIYINFSANSDLASTKTFFGFRGNIPRILDWGISLSSTR